MSPVPSPLPASSDATPREGKLRRQTDRQDRPASDEATAERGNRLLGRNRHVRDSHSIAPPPPRTTSSGEGTKETRTSAGSKPAALMVPSSRSSSSSLARMRLPSGLQATYLPAYFA